MVVCSDMNAIGKIPAHTVFVFLNRKALYDGGQATMFDELYDAYRDWCSDNGVSPVVAMWFGRYVREHAKNQGHSIRLAQVPPKLLCYVGIGWKEAPV
jgi:phage/plasmid-associated DNA primase